MRQSIDASFEDFNKVANAALLIERFDTVAGECSEPVRASYSSSVCCCAVQRDRLGQREAQQNILLSLSERILMMLPRTRKA